MTLFHFSFCIEIIGTSPGIPRNLLVTSNMRITHNGKNLFLYVNNVAVWPFFENLGRFDGLGMPL